MSKKRVTIIVIAVAVVIAVICLSKAFKSSLSTVKATYSYFEDCFEVEGIVIRNEEVYEKDENNIFETSKKEGDRVSAGKPIGILYGKDAPKSVINKIAEIDNRISELEKQEFGLETVYEDAGKVDSQMIAAIENMVSSSQKFDGQGITSSKYELDRLLDNKLVIEGKKESPTNELSELEARRDEMEAELEKQDVVSSASGILTYTVDGFESDITVDKIKKFKPEIIDTWLSYKAKVPENAYLKIIDNENWYYSFNITENQLDNLKIGDSAYIKTSTESTELVPVSIKNISKPSEDKRVTVTIECERDIDSAFTNRRPKFVFVKKVYEGFKVPKKAVIVKKDVVGVYALMGGIVEFRPISIVYSSDEYIMISNEYDEKTNRIHMYDEIILSTEDVKEGMLFT